MLDKTAFAKRLRELREAKGWTQKEAAEKCGIVCSTYSAYENKKNTKSPLLEVAVQMAEGYGITLNELCGMEAKPPEAPKAVEPPAEDHVYTCAEIARLLMELQKKGIVDVITPEGELKLDAGGHVFYHTSVFFDSKSLYNFFDQRHELQLFQTKSAVEIYKTWENGALEELETIYLHGEGKEDKNPR